MPALHDAVLSNHSMNKFLIQLVFANQHMQATIRSFAQNGEESVETFAGGGDVGNAFLTRRRGFVITTRR